MKMKISEELRNKAQEAFDAGKWQVMVDEISQEIENENPDSSEVERINYISSLRREMAEQSGKTTERIKEEKKLQYKKKEQIEETGLKEIGEVSTSDIQNYLDLSWAKEVGDLPLGKWIHRKAIYKYWSDIANKHKDVEEALETLIKEFKKLDKIKDFPDYKEGMNELAEKEVPAYVVKLGAIPLKAPDGFRTAIRILKYYSEIEGVIGPEETVELDEKGRRAMTDEATRRSAGDFRSTELPKETVNMDVDPIFWYKYRSDYENINIPKTQIADIKHIMRTSPLKFAYLSDEELDEFDDWFDKFIIELGRDEDYTGKFFLPISPFMLDLPKESGEKDWANVDDEIIEFFELIDDLLEETEFKTQFTVYQKKMTGRDEDSFNIFEVRSDAERRRGSRRGEDRLISMNRKDIQELDGAWNKFLRALNEYYVKPTSSKWFVQSNQRPRWAKSHAAFLIALKNAKENPIGSLLDKTIDKGLHKMNHHMFDDLTEFIRMARKSGARTWDKKYFRDGKRAVMALDAIFGDNWHEKNMDSIGYILYDMAKKLRIPEDNIEDMAIGFWKNIKKHYDDYDENYIYPIDQLRYALNTPEFTSWLGISKERDVWSEKPFADTDKKLIEAIKKLDAAFDDFHKMDDINISMLEAHDTIRKMNNESIIHARLSLSSIADMDLVINKLHVEQKMDLTATEIDKIVKAVSSYESLANNFGINEETVYTLKALFR